MSASARVHATCRQLPGHTPGTKSVVYQDGDEFLSVQGEEDDDDDDQPLVAEPSPGM